MTQESKKRKGSAFLPVKRGSVRPGCEETMQPPYQAPDTTLHQPALVFQKVQSDHWEVERSEIKLMKKVRRKFPRMGWAQNMLARWTPSQSSARASIVHVRSRVSHSSPVPALAHLRLASNNSTVVRAAQQSWRRRTFGGALTPAVSDRNRCHRRRIQGDVQSEDGCREDAQGLWGWPHRAGL